MAIAGSLLKQAANIVGKAIKVTKKKKGQVGGKLKKQFKKEADFIDKKIVKPAKDRVSKLKDKAKPQFIKGMPNPKAMYAGTKAKASEIADAAVNTQAFTKGAKAIKVGRTKAKAGLGKAQGIAGGLADDTMAAIKASPTRALELGGAAILTGALSASIIKSNTNKDSLYKIERTDDGQFKTQFTDANKNMFISTKQLSTKDMDIVRKGIAVMDSILMSDDPRKQRREFVQIVAYLNRYHGITSVQGKNLNIVIPHGLNAKGNKTVKISHKGQFDN